MDNNSVKPANIEALIGEFEASGCVELHVRFEGFELHLSTDPTTAAQSGPTPAAPSARSPAAAVSASLRSVALEAAVPAETDDLEGFEIICAPYQGTFYRSPKPGAPVYVETGSTVTAETDLCLVEVMKLFTAVRAGTAGTIAKILATDGQMVEGGQPLFAIDVKG